MKNFRWADFFTNFTCISRFFLTGLYLYDMCMSEKNYRVLPQTLGLYNFVSGIKMIVWEQAGKNGIKDSDEECTVRKPPLYGNHEWEEGLSLYFGGPIIGTIFSSANRFRWAYITGGVNKAGSGGGGGIISGSLRYTNQRKLKTQHVAFCVCWCFAFVRLLVKIDFYIASL